ncbi:hypothetical protein [Hyalangium versicolor]|uniref:hypothetical protein n=1 Tax=Hyalangium versicolor TaxID=2861190 RepID=UPI001CCD5E34|nr:hypothetical protein [Hyalangium versicolor]
MKMGCWRGREGLLLLVLILAAATAEPAPEARPRLELLGAHPIEGLKLPLHEPALKRSLTIQSTTAAPVTALKVVVSPLRDSTGQLWEAQWDLGGKGQDTPVSVAAYGSVALEVRAELPATGTYVGDIFLLYGEGESPASVPFIVTRGPKLLSVMVKELLPVEATAEPIGTSKATLRFAVEETSGQDVLLEPPVVVGLSRISRAAVKFQAPVQVTVPEPLTLKGGAARELQLELSGLAGAGEYQGKLLLKSEGAQAVEREVRLFLREPWWVAFLFITVGVGLSLFLRWVVQGLQPRLELQQSVLLLRQDLAQEAQAWEPFEPLEHQVLTAVLSEADRLNTRIATGATKQPQALANLAVLKSKRELLPVWVEIRRYVRGVRPVQLQAPHLDRLSVAERRLLDAQAKAEELDQSREELGKTPLEVVQSVREELKKSLDALETEVKKHRDTPLGRKLDTEVVPHLETARRHLAVNEFPQAFEAYEQARRAYLKLLVEQLNSQLPVDAPLGFSKEAWEELRRRVLAELEAARTPNANLEAAFEAYTRAQRLFLSEAARALIDGIPSLQQRVEASTEISKEAKAASKERLEALKPRLQEVALHAQDGRVVEAAAAYEEIRRTLQKELDDVKVRSIFKPLQVNGPGLAALVPALSEGSSSARLGVLARPLDLQSVTRWRWSLALAVSGFLSLVVGLLGVLALWAGDQTWGGFSAYATAFLWGLGLHQATFTTFAGLAEALVGKKASP